MKRIRTRKKTHLPDSALQFHFEKKGQKKNTRAHGHPGRPCKPLPPGKMKRKHFAMALCAWMLLAAAPLRPIAAAEQQVANSTTASRLSPSPVPSSTSTSSSTKPKPAKIKRAGAAIDLKTRPNDVYAPQNGSFDYFKLQVYWPPSIFKPQQQGQVRIFGVLEFFFFSTKLFPHVKKNSTFLSPPLFFLSLPSPRPPNPTPPTQIWYLMKQQYAAKDFWTHGMWPSAAKGKDPAWCNATAAAGARVVGQTLAAMAGLDLLLPFYLSFDRPRQRYGSDSFWKHQWEKHGSCSGMSQRDYFLAVYAASAGLKLQQRLLPLGITFGNKRGHNYTFLRKADGGRRRRPRGPPAREGDGVRAGPREQPGGPGDGDGLRRQGVAEADSRAPPASLARRKRDNSTSLPLSIKLSRRSTTGRRWPSSSPTPRRASTAPGRPEGTEIFLPALLNGIASSDQGWITAKGSAWFLFAAFAALFPLLALAWSPRASQGGSTCGGPRARSRSEAAVAARRKRSFCCGRGGRKAAVAAAPPLPLPPPPSPSGGCCAPRVVCNPRVAEDRVDVLEHALSLSRLEKTEHGGRGGGRELARALRALPVGAGITDEAARRVARLAFPADAASDASASDASAAASSAPSSEPSQARLVFFVPGGARTKTSRPPPPPPPTSPRLSAAAMKAGKAVAPLREEGASPRGASPSFAAAAAPPPRRRRRRPLSTGLRRGSLTFDELVVCRVSAADDEDEGAGLVLLSTPAGLDDARARIARPAAHGPRGWELGEAVAAKPEALESSLPASPSLPRSLPRSRATPRPRRSSTRPPGPTGRGRRLSKAALFRLLLPFHADTRSYLAALDAAASFGLVSRKDVRDCGGPNALWGVLIDEMNDIASRAAGVRARRARPRDVDADVEGDADRSEARAAEEGAAAAASGPCGRGPWRPWFAARRGSKGEEQVEVVRKKRGRAASSSSTPRQRPTAAAERVSQRLALKAKAKASAAASDAVAAPKPPQPFAAPLPLPPLPPPPLTPPSSRPPPTPQQSAFRRRLSRISGRSLEEGPFFPPPPPPPSAASAAAAAPAAAAATDVDFDAASVAATAAVRSRAAARLAATSSVVGAAAFDRTRGSEAGPRGRRPAAAAAAPNALSAAAAAVTAPSDDKSMSKSTKSTGTAKDAAPASFYAPAEPEAGVLEADDAPERQRVPLLRLAQFLAGVAAASPGFLAAAYVALLCSVVSQLLVPLAFAMGFHRLVELVGTRVPDGGGSTSTPPRRPRGSRGPAPKGALAWRRHEWVYTSSTRSCRICTTLFPADSGRSAASTLPLLVQQRTYHAIMSLNRCRRGQRAAQGGAEGMIDNVQTVEKGRIKPARPLLSVYDKTGLVEFAAGLGRWASELVAIYQQHRRAR